MYIYIYIDSIIEREQGSTEEESRDGEGERNANRELRKGLQEAGPLQVVVLFDKVHSRC